MKLFLCILFLAASTANAKTLISAQCEEPKGQRLDYIKSKIKSSPDSYSGSKPSFLISSDNPETLIVIWPDSASLGNARKQNTVEANIIAIFDEMITASYTYENRVDMYTLYPKAGLAFLSTHKLFPMGNIPIAMSFATKCWFDANGG